jgi:GMP synthase-like glutamine amidotransferase
MRVLVFQHINIEHPGVFREFLDADGIRWDAIELDEGEAIPSFADYDLLWVMGGPMDTFEEDVHPWLVAEKEAIREAVAVRGLPFIGFCLGHQLLADALGGEVGRTETPEVGIMDVELTAAGQSDPLYAGAAARADYFQWHSCGVLGLPEGGVGLARSPACEIQAMRVGDSAYGIQYHVELTPDTVTDWAAVPAYAEALDSAMGEGALERLDADAATRMPEFNREARRLYDCFMAIARA